MTQTTEPIAASARQGFLHLPAGGRRDRRGSVQPGDDPVEHDDFGGGLSFTGITRTPTSLRLIEATV